jgi:hypothetical protein
MRQVATIKHPHRIEDRDDAYSLTRTTLHVQPPAFVAVCFRDGSFYRLGQVIAKTGKIYGP